MKPRSGAGRLVLALTLTSLVAACPPGPGPRARTPSASPDVTSSPSPRPEPPDHTPPLLRRKVSTETYPVGGATSGQIVASLRQRGPGRFWAQTRWSIGWTYESAEVGASCRSDAVVVTLNLTFVFPRWRAPAGASAATRAWWSRTRADLRRHESGHLRIAEGASRQLLLALAHLGAFPSCGRLRHVADARARAAYRRGVELQRIYDRVTDHGRSQ